MDAATSITGDGLCDDDDDESGRSRNDVNRTNDRDNHSPTSTTSSSSSICGDGGPTNHDHHYNNDPSTIMTTATSNDSQQQHQQPLPHTQTNQTKPTPTVVAATDASDGGGSPSPTSSTFLGHFAAVLSHSLPSHFARALRRCRSITTLVVIGKHDSVVTPSSSRALASAIDANTVIEIDAAHFVTDEAVSEITTQLVYGLRKAFLAPVSTPCTCPWCDDEDDDREKGK